MRAIWEVYFRSACIDGFRARDFRWACGEKDLENG